MPSTGLNGPYPLTHPEIRRVASRTSPGAYALGESRNGTFYINYVGRSDSDIAARLSQHVGAYSQFKFGYFGSPKAAFEKECRLWHDFGGPSGNLDNKVQSARPTGANWQCPVCNVFREAHRLLSGLSRF